MEIDDTLKNRLAGTAVVTVLAVIFLPMLFDDPVEKKGQVVSELGIPQKSEVSPLLATAIVPDKSSEASKKPSVANADTATAEDVTDNSEKPATGLEPEKDSPDSDVAALEENPAPVKKKSVKKATDEPEEDAASLPQKKKKTAEAKVTKEPTKMTPPVLDAHDLDKKTTASPPTLDKQRWTVQVVSLSDQAKATAFRDKLRSQGFPANIDSVWVKGKGRVYRLKVGPELDAQKAQSMKAKINQLNNVQSIAIAE